MNPEPEAQGRTVALPTGTVTFLFTDIEGSSQRWETHRDSMDAAVKRHDVLMRSAMEAHGGHVFKTVGDAFCVVFTRVSDAVAACADAQRSLSAEDFAAVEGLHVRSALHTGEAVERNGDYFGPAVNRVSRIMSIGHGGQVLLSGATRELAHSDLPSGASLADLGSQRLKDLTEPEQVWQLNLTGLPTEFPPLKSLDALPNNLPIQRTTFVGRQHDLAEVKGLVARHRLLTLVGAGGVGKTRLALQMAADLLDHHPDGVWCADFAPITDPELVSSVIAKVLGMSQEEGRRVDESIPPWLKRKKLLLILDNCEHVLEAVASLAGAILNTAPDVRILITSRQALDIGGEVVHRLPSLSIPTKAVGLRMDEALQYGAVALFVDRAKAADTRFALNDETASVVADICRRLDGIPLAIELAAARVKVLSIPNLAQRLDERFKILTSGGRDVLPRQKTLSALIDWSYDLLSEREQTLFNRLGVFAGGFGLDAATAVCAGAGVDEIDILDLLSSLTDKSLVAADTGGDQERYHLLESTRAYALGKLSAAGERDRLARRQAEYFHDIAQAADETFGTMSTVAWLERLEPEVDNFRALMEWAIKDSHDAALGGAVAGALERLWYEGGLSTEGRWWIGAALERANETEQPRVAARLWRALARLSTGKRMRETADRALTLYESLGDGRGVGRALGWLGYALTQMGRSEEAKAFSERAIAALREQGDKPGLADCLNQYASILQDRGDLAKAREVRAEALGFYRAVGDERGISISQANLAETEFAAGNPDQALRYAGEAIAIDSRGKNAASLAINNSNIAAYRIALGDLAGGLQAARNGLRCAREAQAAYIIAIACQHIALVSALRGEARRAGRLRGYTDARYKELGVERESTEKWGYDKLMALLNEKLSEAEITKLEAEGAAWSEDQAVEEALKV